MYKNPDGHTTIPVRQVNNYMCMRRMNAISRGWLPEVILRMCCHHSMTHLDWRIVVIDMSARSSGQFDP